MMSVPSYEEILQLPSLIEGRVGPEHLDDNDHVNIQHYLVWAAEAVAERFIPLGMGLQFIEPTGYSQFTAEYHLTYVTELRCGVDFSGHVRVLDRGSRSMHAIAFVLDRTQQKLSFVAELLALNVLMADRRTADFSTTVASVLDDAISEDATLSWAAPICGSMGIRR